MIKGSQKHFYLMNKKNNKPKSKIEGSKSTSETNRTSVNTISKQIYNWKYPYLFIRKYLFRKYNILPKDYDRILLENFVQSKYCHNIAVFKEKLIFNFQQEFLKRAYTLNESKVRIKKCFTYYKNYLAFFGKPLFSELNLNDVIQVYGEKKAQLFYNQNYKDELSEQEESSNKSKITKTFNTIFTSFVRENISRKTTTSEYKEDTLLLDNSQNEIIKNQLQESKENTLIKIVQNLSPKKSFISLNDNKDEDNKKSIIPKQNLQVKISTKKLKISSCTNLTIESNSGNRKSSTISPSKNSIMTPRVCYTECNKVDIYSNITQAKIKKSRNPSILLSDMHKGSTSSRGNKISNNLNLKNVYSTQIAKNINSFKYHNYLNFLTKRNKISLTKKTLMTNENNQDRKKPSLIPSIPLITKGKPMNRKITSRNGNLQILRSNNVEESTEKLQFHYNNSKGISFGNYFKTIDNYKINRPRIKLSKEKFIIDIPKIQKRVSNNKLNLRKVNNPLKFNLNNKLFHIKAISSQMS